MSSEPRAVGARRGACSGFWLGWLVLDIPVLHLCLEWSIFACSESWCPASMRAHLGSRGDSWEAGPDLFKDDPCLPGPQLPWTACFQRYLRLCLSHCAGSSRLHGLRFLYHTLRFLFVSLSPTVGPHQPTVSQLWCPGFSLHQTFRGLGEGLKLGGLALAHVG